MMYNATPRLPKALLHILTVSERTFARDPNRAGQSRPIDTVVSSFWGIVLPLSDADWRRLPEGTYTRLSEKLYTDDNIDIKPGQIIRDTFNGQQYTVVTELQHSTLHPMVRYIVEGVSKR